jgi:hypothetical protein
MPATVYIVHRFPSVGLALGIGLVLTSRSPGASQTVGFEVLHRFNTKFQTVPEDSSANNLTTPNSCGEETFLFSMGSSDAQIVATVTPSGGNI